MTVETKAPFVDTKTVAAAGTPEQLTTREVNVDSIFIKPIEGQSGELFLVDSTTMTKKITIGTAGITLPTPDPRIIFIDVETNGQGAEWVAV